MFIPEHLRVPTEEHTQRLMTEGEVRVWPRMLGVLSYMQWTWKNCPAGWKCQYKGHCNDPLIILEAVALKDRWIWHLFFGLPGFHDDLNVLSRSPQFSRLIQGEAPG